MPGCVHRRSLHWTAVIAGLGVLIAACDDNITESTIASSAHNDVTEQGPPAPIPLVDVPVDGGTLRIWPFIGADFAGTQSDPVNLVFTGEADPLAIRAALLGLDGNRAAFGFPSAFPFDCTWSDAFGDILTAWSAEDGWVANPVQLQCGTYGPLRFHLRLFPAGAHTVANAHFELLIPGTTEHQVLSWELAEQLVVADFLRSGLLDATSPAIATAVINPAPAYREIPAVIYNGLPGQLKVVIGGPAGSVTDPVPIISNGRATVLDIATRPAIIAGDVTDEFSITFDQLIPKPFCNDGDDFVRVQGPVHFHTRATITGIDGYHLGQTARGTLQVTPINPITGAPLGETYQALVENIHQASITPAGVAVDALVRRQELPVGVSQHGSIFTRIITAPAGVARFHADVRC